MTGRAAAGAGPRPKTPLLPGEIRRPALPAGRDRRAGEIIAAARRILESEGPEALTMRRVAGELGIQAPSLYKHFPGKAAVEAELIVSAMTEIGEMTHRAIHRPRPYSRLMALLRTYRQYGLANAALYRLATQGSLARDLLPPGLEEWAGNPWSVVTGDQALVQALWSFAHGMVILEIDGRYPPGSDLNLTWRAGGAAFERHAALE